ncbi:MAG: hypothetical protein LBU74_06505 [Methanobacteriaceae archaeon]|jgi:hypothetical protein|nr:hypothetical protein [Candidatus Methanorudis spinitermitis]
MNNFNKKADKFETKSTFNKSILKSFLLLTLLGIVFFTLISGVNAKTFYEGVSSNDIQNFINDNNEGNTIIFSAGTYNNLQNLNITRSVNITSNGQVNIKGNGGILFNITANDVNITKLNISGYQTAIKSNNSKISIIGNSISTSDISINCTGSNSIDILIENNTIISSISNSNYGAIYVSASTGSIVSASVKNNNIIAKGVDNSNGVYFWTYSCNNTLNFENNIIIGTTGKGVYLYIHHSKNNITFTKNHIMGNGTVEGDGILGYAHDSNNNLTFTDNNISGKRYGVFLYVLTSSNNITFTNNKIVGEWRAVKIDAFSGNNTITFINNNIIGYEDGFEMPAASSTNNITLINNNITGYLSGVCFDAPSSNNTLTFIGNNLKGTLNPGLDIYVPVSNNNIILINNNITGENAVALNLEIYSSSKNILTVFNNNITGMKWGGIYLDASNSNNAVLSFVGNNITGNGNSYAMRIDFWGEFSGLSILNNTFNSNGIGLHFRLYGVVLSNVNITGNTILATSTGIYFHENNPSSVALTVNYNRIIAPVGLNFIATTDNGCNFDYNWWGINDISDKVVGFHTNNHYILNIINLTSLENVFVGDKVNFALLVLNTTLTNIGVENLPYFDINGTFNGIDYNTNRDSLFVHEFIILNEGLQFLNASLDEQYVDLSFNASFADIEEPDNGTDIGDSGNGTDIEDLDNGTDIGDSGNDVEIEDPSNGTYNDYSSNNPDGEELVFDKKDNEDNKDTIKYKNTDKNTNNPKNTFKMSVGMKSTGINIVILLILAILSLITYRRNNK